MKSSLLNIVLVILAVFVVTNLRAEVVTDGTIGTGYQSNLFNDSNLTGDAFTYAGLQLMYYPSDITQLAVGAKYNAFTKYSDLSNLNGDISLTIIPLPASSPLSVTLSGAMVMRKFGQIYQLYNQTGANLSTKIGYRLAPTIHLQSTVSFLNTSYTNSDYGSNQNLDFGMGLNFTVLSSNSLALMLDYSRRSFDQPTLIQEGTEFSIVDGQNRSETFEITGAMLRFSRPFGETTGFNLSIGYRQLHIDNDYTVLGYTVDYLSPWSDLWEGASILTGLKHIFANQVIGEFAVAHYDKTYVEVIELADSNEETYWQDDRYDQLTTISLTLSKTISLKSGKKLIPSLFLGYRNNHSTTSFFEYDDIQASLSLKVGL